jgi:NAD(P)-dependent dehydrogenase (short-subunit alcohol dehydrogenase family)
MYIPDGIRCNVIAPGGFKTEIGSSMVCADMAATAGCRRCSPPRRSPRPGGDRQGRAVFVQRRRRPISQETSWWWTAAWTAG